MSRPASDYIAHLDWEELNSPQTIEGPFLSPALFDGASKYSLSRDEDYNVIGMISGQSAAHEATEQEFGLMLNPRDVTIQEPHLIFDIKRLSLKSITRTPQAPMGANNNFNISAPFSAHSYKIRHTLTQEPCYSFREWYLNAPPNNHYLRQQVERKKTVIYEHNRRGPHPVSDRFEMMLYGQYDLAYLAIKTDRFQFLIERVPNSFFPIWSEKLMVEYREEWGLVPDEKTRNQIAELLGYLLGRRLISIGASILSRKGFIIEAVAKSHHQPNIRHLCKKYPHYPIDLKESPELFEAAFIKALNAYKSKQEYLPISECLHRYWLASELPLGLNIVILASTLEMLANAWFKSNESTSHGKYMPHDEYRELLSPEIEALADKLDKTEMGKAIIKRILSSNQFGANDKTNTFFSELGITLATEDKNILRDRNKYAHGGEINVIEARRCWAIYQSLFNHALLRILDLR